MPRASLPPRAARALRADGFVAVPDVVPARLVRAALAAIRRAIGRDRAEGPGADARLVALGRRDVILDLYRRSRLGPMVKSLLGTVEPVVEGLVVLRFPQRRREAPGPLYHVDGVPTPDNGITPGAPVSTKTLIAAVFLSDVPAPDHGNYSLCPGSHVALSRRLRESGPETLARGLPELPLRPPVQVLARAGDAVLSHYLTVHTGEQNLSRETRYAVFFMVRRAGHDALGARPLLEPWLEWPGLIGHKTPRPGPKGPRAPLRRRV